MSVSAEAMRGAIRSCSNPNVYAFMSRKLSKQELTGDKSDKDAAREYIQNNSVFESCFIATCGACGEVKDAEKAFKCSAW